jgi:hypothetical protein
MTEQTSQGAANGFVRRGCRLPPPPARGWQSRAGIAGGLSAIRETERSRELKLLQRDGRLGPLQILALERLHGGTVLSTAELSEQLERTWSQVSDGMGALCRRKLVTGDDEGWRLA